MFVCYENERKETSVNALTKPISGAFDYLDQLSGVFFVIIINLDVSRSFSGTKWGIPAIVGEKNHKEENKSSCHAWKVGGEMESAGDFRWELGL